MSRVPFTKLHGLGNDFLVVDLTTLAPAVAAELQAPDTVRWLCDRQFGVGGDGVLALSAGRTPGAVATMRVLNADGSEAEMCGNGIRCVAKFLRERDPSLGQRLVVDTGAGPLACDVTLADDGTVTAVTVGMGRPRLTRGEIPATGPADERWIAGALAIAGDAVASRAVTAVSMGNPHAVVFVDDPDTVHDLARAVGPALEVDPAFPRKTNAEFAAMRGPDVIELGVWERGCGITLACGTGACATAVAACLTGRITPGAPVEVRLPGGALTITVAADYSAVAMRGPARAVFTGEVDLAHRGLARRP
ncbi:MAG: diaminopimelate epimerase [Kofleriaceae bacterium]